MERLNGFSEDFSEVEVNKKSKQEVEVMEERISQIKAMSRAIRNAQVEAMEEKMLRIKAMEERTSRIKAMSRARLRAAIVLIVALVIIVLSVIGAANRAYAQVMPGDTLIIDLNAGTGANGALFRVRPNGSRTLVNDFGNSAQGPSGVDPIGAALDSSGNILVIDPSAGTDGRGALFRVNPANGNRTLVNVSSG